MDAWSTFAQDPKDGHIWESLGYTGRPMDDGGGRYMGDTTSLYLLEMYELFRHNGNLSFVKSQWDSAKKATAWMIGNAMGDDKGKPSVVGLPQRLSTTCECTGTARPVSLAVFLVLAETLSLTPYACWYVSRTCRRSFRFPWAADGGLQWSYLLDGAGCGAGHGGSGGGCGDGRRCCEGERTVHCSTLVLCTHARGVCTAIATRRQWL